MGRLKVLFEPVRSPEEETLMVEVPDALKVAPVAFMVPATAICEPPAPLVASVTESPVLKVSIPSSVRVASFSMSTVTFVPTVRAPSDAIVKPDAKT